MVKNTKIVVPLKYLGNFWRSWEIRLINCKAHLKLNSIEDCILSSVNLATFKIDAKWYVPILAISTKDNVNLTKQLSDGFKRSVYWNQYQIIPAKVINKKELAYMNYLVHHFKVLNNYLFLFMLFTKIEKTIKNQ